METGQLKNKRILLVDDEQELLNMVVSILKDDGFSNIKTAMSVSEALIAAQSFKPQLAVLDVMLPDGDGFSLMSELKKCGDFPILFFNG